MFVPLSRYVFLVLTLVPLRCTAFKQELLLEQEGATQGRLLCRTGVSDFCHTDIYVLCLRKSPTPGWGEHTGKEQTLQSVPHSCRSTFGSMRRVSHAGHEGAPALAQSEVSHSKGCVQITAERYIHKHRGAARKSHPKFRTRRCVRLLFHCMRILHVHLLAIFTRCRVQSFPLQPACAGVASAEMVPTSCSRSSASVSDRPSAVSGPPQTQTCCV